MPDSGVYDRWHKANPKPGEPRCREHRRVPPAAHGRSTGPRPRPRSRRTYAASVVAGIFRAGVRDRLIVASPCIDIRLPRPEPKLWNRWLPSESRPSSTRCRSAIARWSRWLPVPACGREEPSPWRLRQSTGSVGRCGSTDSLCSCPAGNRTSPHRRRQRPTDGAAPPGRRGRAGCPPGRVSGRSGRGPGRDAQAGFQAAHGGAGVHLLDRPAAAPDQVLRYLERRGGHGRARRRGDVPRPAPLLREPAHPAR